MKPVKNLVLAALLVSTLAFNTLAGDIDMPGYVPPPPPRMTVSDDDSTIPVNGTETQEIVSSEASDYLLFEALAALLSMY
jgi:hypothetical protein